MDPNACLQRLIDAILADDGAEAFDADEDLATWIRRGGFEPKRFHDEPKMREAFNDGWASMRKYVRQNVPKSA